MNNEKTIVIMKEVLSLIDTPDKWIKNHNAMDKFGLKCSSQSIEACKFCIVGAFLRVFRNHGLPYIETTIEFLKPLVNNKGFGSLDDFNDHSTTSWWDVVDLFHEAINLLETSNERL